MYKRQYPVTEEHTVEVQEPRVLAIFKDNSKSHPRYYTSLYDEHGNLKDDGIDLDTERDYFEAFVDRDQALKLREALKKAEDPDYVPSLVVTDD